MRLARMEICGFKSFGTRVQLEFPSDLCAIVGPNGCGKSNVVDAIRWVMGEQSARSLRGRTMEDVIFAGSQNRPAAAMAEVTLVFARDERHPPPLPSLNFPEIRVTRILHRDGTSEYKLMNQTCRLKDIVDVFAGTGLGSRSYAIIEQGKIASVIAARPDERRQLFEEAAQISRYRIRRRESEKRLEESHHHLNRIGDIVRELEMRLRQLERQKNVAQRYDELQAQLYELDRWRFVHQGRELKAQIQQKHAELRSIEEHFTQHQTELATARTVTQELQLQKTEAESQYRATVDMLIDLEKRIAQVRLAQQMARNESEQAARTIESLRTRQEQTRKKLANVQDLILQSEEKYRHLESVVAVKREEREQIEQEFRTARNVRQDIEGALSQKRTEVLQLEKTVAAQKALAENAARKREVTIARQKELEDEQRQLQTQLEDITKKTIECEKQLQKTRAQTSELNEVLQQLESTLHPAEERLSELEKNRLAKHQHLISLQGKLDYLNDFLRNHLDADEKTRKLWEKLEQQGMLDGLAGPLFDAFEPDPKAVDDLEMVLSGQLQNPRLAQLSDIEKIVELAVRECRGVQVELPQISFHSSSTDSLEESIQIQKESNADSKKSAEHSIGNPNRNPPVPDTWIPISSYVRVKDTRFTHRLSGWYRVPSLTDALASIDQIPAEGGCITDPGIIIQRHSLRIHESGPQTSLRIRTERDILAQTVEKTASEIRLLEEKISQAMAEHSDLQQKIREAKEHVAAAQNHVRALEMEENRLRTQHTALQQMIEDRKQSLESLQQDLEVSMPPSEDFSALLHQKQEELNRDLERYREIAARADALAEQVQNARVSMESWLQKVESEKRMQQRLQEEVVAIESTMEEIESGIALASSRMQLQEKEAAIHESALFKLEEQLQDLRTHHEQVRIRLDELSNQWNQSNEKIRKLERQLVPLSNRRVELKNDISRIEGNLGYLERDFAERFLLEHLDVLIESEVFLKPFCEVQKQQREQIIEELDELRGDYNQNAIKEYNEVQERLKGLQSQFADLNKAVGDLEKAIAYITELSRDRLLETFSGIAQRFSKLFPRLFGGGTATLRLLEGDPLEAGVDVLVQLPGKRTQVMELLSGGEKAMTAIALLFSMFLYRPSPVCVLDEVDAPLDESNVDKYNALLREMSKNTQFLVITHNRRTMEAVDNILGVTMEEPGCSFVYSVQLDRRH